MSQGTGTRQLTAFQTRPLVIAHRGASGIAPENTLAAFQAALALPVDGVELDYRHTADGVPVVFHDATLDRTTNAAALWQRTKVALAECSAVELAQLDAGSWFGSAKSFVGEPIPTLASALALICNSQRWAVVERKAGDAATLIHLLRQGGWLHAVVVMAFDWSFLADCRKLEADLPLVALGEGSIDAHRLEQARQAGASIMGWNQVDLTPENIAIIHAAGMATWTWTVDKRPRIAELCSAGIDAITSNYPDRVIEYLANSSATPAAMPSD